MWSPPWGEPREVPACEADAQRVERGEDPTRARSRSAASRCRTGTPGRPTRPTWAASSAAACCRDLPRLGARRGDVGRWRRLGLRRVRLGRRQRRRRLRRRRLRRRGTSAEATSGAAATSAEGTSRPPSLRGVKGG
jgi:hypothetical protein